MNILWFILSVWLGIVAIVVGLDILTDYLVHRPVKTKTKRVRKTLRMRCREVNNRITAYRNKKKLVSGLSMVCKRETSIVHPRGAHRRVAAT